MFIPLKDENPTLRYPIVTLSLIVANCLVFFYQALSPNGLEYYVLKFGIIPYEITHLHLDVAVPRVVWPISLLTGMFMHGSLFHLLGNMLYLWIFGNNVEDYLGHWRFVFFYLACGLTASLVQVAVYPNSTVPMIGASGAIAGLLGAYLLLYPGARVKTLVFLFFYFTVIYVPAWVLLSLWFVLQVSNIGLGGGVAWFAHIGGFLTGMGLISLRLKRHRPFYYV
ncbi:MAG: rhomboid family intramembrane serine protease [Candidatus Aminicenantes bacterium]|nr:rhomboid family intramembrane serine protease [Candidatus Aminicenantes bacterium]